MDVGDTNENEYQSIFILISILVTRHSTFKGNMHRSVEVKSELHGDIASPVTPLLLRLSVWFSFHSVNQPYSL